MFNQKKLILKLSTSLGIILVVIILSTILIYFFASQTTAIVKKIQENKKLSYIMKNKEETNSQILQDFKFIGEDYNSKILATIPSEDNILPFVEAMESIAKKNSLEQVINFSNPTTQNDDSNPGLTEINFSLAITNANIITFANYLNDFEKLPYFAGISSISFLSPTNSGWNNNSTININGKIYAKQ